MSSWRGQDRPHSSLYLQILSETDAYWNFDSECLYVCSFSDMYQLSDLRKNTIYLLLSHFSYQSNGLIIICVYLHCVSTCYGVQMRYISYRYRSYVDICPTGISLTDLFPDHCNKGNIKIKQVTQIFGFLVHIKFMFILYCSLLSMQWHYV